MHNWKQQNENQNIFIFATSGREKVLTLQKPVRILKIQNINPRQILRSQQISWNLDELLKSYKTKLIRRGRFASSLSPAKTG